MLRFLSPKSGYIYLYRRDITYAKLNLEVLQFTLALGGMSMV